jgi:PAS domain-containing protein
MTDQFAALAGIASDWWWQMDADLRFTYFSPRFTDVFGIPIAAVLGRSRTEVPRSDYDRPGWRAFPAAVSRGSTTPPCAA